MNTGRIQRVRLVLGEDFFISLANGGCGCYSIKVNRAECLGNKQQSNLKRRKRMKRNNHIGIVLGITVAAGMALMCHAYDDPMRGVLNNIVTGPKTTMPVQEDRTMSYHISNSSGSRIEALYFKGDGMSSWSEDCLSDSATLDWINASSLHAVRSCRLYGTPKAIRQSGRRERDLNGNYGWSAGSMDVDVPLGGYDGEAYRMKVRWADGTEREFYLPYPWGDVTIYKNQARVYLGISGRGLFYNNWIDAL